MALSTDDILMDFRNWEAPRFSATSSVVMDDRDNAVDKRISPIDSIISDKDVTNSFLDKTSDIDDLDKSSITPIKFTDSDQDNSIIIKDDRKYDFNESNDKIKLVQIPKVNLHVSESYSIYDDSTLSFQKDKL